MVSFKGAATSPGDIFALLWVFGVFLSRPMRNVPWTLVIFLDGYTSSKRLENFFRLPSEAEPKSGWQPIDASSSSDSSPTIEVRDLSLTLGGKKILDKVSFSVPAGSFVVITGEVGSGKTQLLLSLLRDCPAEFGRYLLNGKDAASIELSELRRNFAYVPQDGFVMSATLRENIAFSYGAPTELDEKIMHALKLADFRLDEEVQSGLGTEIGERGVNLSGGQRQRVGLARGWFHGCGVILLDDCLSAVDVETEKILIERLFKGAWGKKTRILVSHRLSVIEHADLVFVMENGRLSRKDHHV